MVKLSVFTFVFCSVFSLACFAQSGNTIRPSVEKGDSVALSEVDDLPYFGEHGNEILKYIANTLVYPDQAKEVGLEGTVKVRFLVQADGTLTEVSVMSGIGGGCDEEALRIVKEMPAWVPGFKDGRPVPVMLILPIPFALNKPVEVSMPQQAPLSQERTKGGKG